jgi:TolA-binding protein
MRSENIPARKSKKPLYVGSFSVLAVLVLTGALTIFPGRHQNNEEILNRYYKEYVPTSEQRSLATIKNDNFNQAMEFFESHDYRNAAYYFSKVVESNPKNMSANLLNGIANFEESKYNEAKQSLGKVLDDNNKNLYIDQAQWYLALCFMRTDENDKARQLLGIIIKEDGFYARDAKKVIKKMN